tara:strand:+ start:4153 stop:4284 length:132 start_codon:yes stop_codon:yes gene_type:complete
MGWFHTELLMLAMPLTVKSTFLIHGESVPISFDARFVGKDATC